MKREKWNQFLMNKSITSGPGDLGILGTKENFHFCCLQQNHEERRQIAIKEMVEKQNLTDKTSDLC